MPVGVIREGQRPQRLGATSGNDDRSILPAGRDEHRAGRGPITLGGTPASCFGASITAGVGPLARASTLGDSGRPEFTRAVRHCWLPNGLPQVS